MPILATAAVTALLAAASVVNEFITIISPRYSEMN